MGNNMIVDEDKAYEKRDGGILFEEGGRLAVPAVPGYECIVASEILDTLGRASMPGSRPDPAG